MSEREYIVTFMGRDACTFGQIKRNKVKVTASSAINAKNKLYDNYEAISRVHVAIASCNR